MAFNDLLCMRVDAVGIYLLIVRRRHAVQGENLLMLLHMIPMWNMANKNKDELHLIQQQMKESIQLIRKSKLGDKRAMLHSTSCHGIW